ncbi:MAG: hypothetical protein AB7Q45_05090, partial [Planctomycetaceae bacterium]
HDSGRKPHLLPPAATGVLLVALNLFREPQWVPRYNVAPTQDALAVRFDQASTPREPVLL